MRWAALALTACRVAIPPVPSQGGPAWHEIASEHFVVWTDGDVDTARAFVQTVEHLRQIELGVSFFNATSNTRGFVIALRGQYEVTPFIPKPFEAIAFPPQQGVFQPMIVLSLDGFDRDPTVVTHEMTHVISYNALRAQPHWFAEGLAVYFETLRIEDDGSFDLGAAPEHRLRELRELGPMNVADLFSCRASACMDSQFYASAWALLSYLANSHPDQLVRYVQRLEEVVPEAQADVFAELFPELMPAVLDKLLANWVKVGELQVHRYREKLREVATTVRSLSDADVLAARGLMRHVEHADGPVPAEIAAAIAADPTNVLARVIEATHSDKFDADVAHQVAAAHPDDWRAWWLLWRALDRGDEANAAVAKLCTAAPANPAALPKGLCP